MHYFSNHILFSYLQNGVMSSIPYICCAIMAVVAGHSADYLRSRHYLTTTQTRKIYQCICEFYFIFLSQLKL